MRKAESAGKSVEQVFPRDTSELCSRCIAFVRKSLSLRMQRCPECGLVMGRELKTTIRIAQGGDHPMRPWSWKQHRSGKLLHFERGSSQPFRRQSGRNPTPSGPAHSPLSANHSSACFRSVMSMMLPITRTTFPSFFSARAVVRTHIFFPLMLTNRHSRS